MTTATTQAPATTPAETLQQMLGAWLTGDGELMLATMSESVEWLDHSPANSGLRGRWVGFRDVAEMLAAFDATSEVTDAAVHHLAADGDVVFAELELAFTVRANGRSHRGPLALICKVEAGRVAQVQVFPSEDETLYA